MRAIAILLVCAMIGSCALIEPKKKKKKRYRPAPAAARHHSKPIPKKRVVSGYRPEYDPVRAENLEKAKKDLNQSIQDANWTMEDDIKKQKEIFTQ
jgi:hypothetical protein